MYLKCNLYCLHDFRESRIPFLSYFIKSLLSHTFIIYHYGKIVNKAGSVASGAKHVKYEIGRMIISFMYCGNSPLFTHLCRCPPTPAEWIWSSRGPWVLCPPWPPASLSPERRAAFGSAKTQPETRDNRGIRGRGPGSARCRQTPRLCLSEVRDDIHMGDGGWRSVGEGVMVVIE